MLITIGTQQEDYRKEIENAFLDALGSDGDKWFEPIFATMPNVEFVTEKEFWGWRSIRGFKAEAWCQNGVRRSPRTTPDGKSMEGWATMLIYFVDHAHYIDGGFGVLYFHSYGNEEVRYFGWRKCAHDFTHRSTGNCQHEYTCTKCGKSYDVDSSG